MTTHSSILAWRILWTEEPGGLQSMGSQKKPDTTEQQLRFQLLENMGYNPRGAQYVLIAYFIWNSPLHRSPLCYPSPLPTRNHEFLLPICEFVFLFVAVATFTSLLHPLASTCK